MALEHPGISYIAQFGHPACESDVMGYADFLRQEAGVGPGPITSLEPIFRRFGLRRPDRIPLPRVRGFVLDQETGHIVIAEDDPAVVQRFTEAHELFELLFKPMSPAARGAHPLFKRKEILCEAGAARLLMDPVGYAGHVRELGVSLASARSLARMYQVSFSAALRRVVELGPGKHAMVIWHMAYSPSERTIGSDGSSKPSPPRRLRICWARVSSPGGFVPGDQAVTEATTMYRAYEFGLMITGEDELNLRGLMGVCRSENKPFQAGAERRVMSLIHLPGDARCAAGDREVGGPGTPAGQGAWSTGLSSRGGNGRRCR